MSTAQARAQPICELGDEEFAARYGCDRFTATVLANRFQYIVEHMCARLLTAAFSPILRDFYDFAVVPSHNGSVTANMHADTFRILDSTEHPDEAFAVMYYLLTGRRPFTGRSALEILRANMQDPPPHPHTVDPMIPAGLVEICLKLLAKGPADRFQSAGELQAALAAWRRSKDGKEEAERHKKILRLRERKAKQGPA